MTQSMDRFWCGIQQSRELAHITKASRVFPDVRSLYDSIVRVHGENKEMNSISRSIKKKELTLAQQKDLFTKWNLFSPRRKKQIAKEYLSGCGKYYSQEGFLNHLRDSFEVEACRETPDIL